MMQSVLKWPPWPARVERRLNSPQAILLSSPIICVLTEFLALSKGQHVVRPQYVVDEVGRYGRHPAFQHLEGEGSKIGTLRLSLATQQVGG